jgi:DNA-binding NarL/FixJ family response regulator
MSARVLVVDGHPVTRWGISHLIDEQDGLDAVGEAAVGEAVRRTVVLVPDVVIVGVVRGDEGLQVAQELRDRFDDLGIVVLGTDDDDDMLLRSFETGVSAFVSRSAPVTELVAAVRHAAVAASSFTAAGLAAALRRRREFPVALDLSPRERQVLDLLVRGRSVPWIADDLHISISTAKTYVGRLYDKLEVRTRAEAVMAAVRLGLVTGPEAAASRPVPAIPVQRRPAAGAELLTGSP